MSANIKIEHNGEAWIDIFTSAEMRELVQSTGENIAAAAGDNFEFVFANDTSKVAVGHVVPANYKGAFEEAEQKLLTKAISKSR